jgi:hypothetical protein
MSERAKNKSIQRLYMWLWEQNETQTYFLRWLEDSEDREAGLFVLTRHFTFNLDDAERLLDKCRTTGYYGVPEVLRFSHKQTRRWNSHAKLTIKLSRHTRKMLERIEADCFIVGRRVVTQRSVN